MFDCIIMNPPFSRNLHLEIVAEAITHLSNDGKCVNLSPVANLVRLVNLYDDRKIKKNSSGVFKVYRNLCEVDVIDFKRNNFTDEELSIPLGIQIYGTVCNSTVDHSKFINSPMPIPLVRKIMKKCMDNSILKYLKKQRNSEFDLPISEIHGSYMNGCFYNVLARSYNKQLNSKGKYFIPFNNEADRRAYYNFMMSRHGVLLTSLWKGGMNVNFKYIPYIWPKNEEEMFNYFELDNSERDAFNKAIENLYKRYNTKGSID